jgi:hypothetical protein
MMMVKLELRKGKLDLESDVTFPSLSALRSMLYAFEFRAGIFKRNKL